MNEAELRTRFPRASPSFIAANSQSPELPKRKEESQNGSREGVQSADHPELERDPRDAALRPRRKKKGHPDRYFVRIVSVRNRLLDEDNLCPKFAVDFLRYCGAIPSDAPGQTKIETTQRKVEEGEDEATLIQVWMLKS